MPRNYVQAPGNRCYHDNTDEKLEECLLRLKSGDISQRDAEKEYKIPRSTMKNKLKSKHTGKCGPTNNPHHRGKDDSGPRNRCSATMGFLLQAMMCLISSNAT